MCLSQTRIVAIPQLEADLQSLQSVLENLQSSLNTFSASQNGSTQTLEQMRTTFESFTLNLNQLIQRVQSLETDQQQHIQEIQSLKHRQQQSTQQTSQDLSKIEAFIPKLANRLNPIQVLLNRTQISTKAVLIALTTAIALTGLLGMELAGLFLNAQFSPMLERMNGRLNNLEIQMNKQHKRLK